MTTSKGRTDLGQLLLFVALLFGIVGMHTLGHPTGHGSMAGQAAHSAHSAHAMPSAPVPAHASSPAAVHEHRMPGDGGMDPLGVCLAVLGSFTLLLLLTAAVPRPPGSALPLGPLRRGLTYAHRPNPPPPRTTLSLLSVLRL
ncbi:DUF6153 family protein [Streptomyces sp. VRA16 Mangrove soil]|uniref:DUF6153 family protein n=1 Tax=Streptomyces sp. VRA16 Mangrove soil TaxID=2817434 RepID=UPI001A9DC434|nr:DUF6153 family protein [Streptomyces sp. VRA16 Mangrove soil]MBO1333239.1 hypothetical protein [Streptomyces sp. VRA16 Mangrove soil]